MSFCGLKLHLSGFVCCQQRYVLVIGDLCRCVGGKFLLSCDLTSLDTQTPPWYVCGAVYLETKRRGSCQKPRKVVEEENIGPAYRCKAAIEVRINYVAENECSVLRFLRRTISVDRDCKINVIRCKPNPMSE